MDKNQKLLLEFLKARYEVSTVPFEPIWKIINLEIDDDKILELTWAYKKLSCREEFEVLAEFAKWGLKNE